MVVRGEIDGRAVFQRIDESQVIEMGEAPDDMVPPIDDDGGVDDDDPERSTSFEPGPARQQSANL